MTDIKPVAWLDSKGHPYHISWRKTAADLRRYGPWQPLHTRAQLDAAVAAERERWQKACAGKRHEGCQYTAVCGSVCNKCGKVA